MKRTGLTRRTPLAARTGLKAGAPLPARQKPLQKITAAITSDALRTRAKRQPLRQGRSTKPPTAEERRRFDAMRRGGCLACHTNSRYWRFASGMPVEIHHLLSGGRRIGHHATVALCRYHHQGDQWPNMNEGYSTTALRFGPSLGREPRAFRAMYGDDATLLVQQGVRLETLTVESAHHASSK